MKHLVYSIFIYFIFCNSAYSQIVMSEVNDLIFETNLRSQLSEDDSFKEVKGTPCLNKEFIEGQIVLKGDTAFNLPLRYNIYKDVLEYRVKDKTYIVGNPEAIKEVVIGDNKLIYLTIKNTNDFNGYYELLCEGKCILLSRKQVRLNEKKLSNGIVPEKPAEFIRLDDKYFIINSSSIPVLVNNKKTLLKCLDDKSSEIEFFLKKNKLSVKKTEDLKSLIEYYNSL